MTTDNLFHVSIPNWDKFNPRADRANHSWFRFQNDFFADQRVFCLLPDHKLLFVLLCCLRSKTSMDSVEFSVGYVYAVLGIPRDSILEGLRRIHDMKLIVTQEFVTQPSQRRRKAVTMPSSRRRSASLLPTTNERTNEQYEQTLQHDDNGGVPPPPAVIPPEEILVQDFHDFLTGIPPIAIRAWLEAYGEPLVRDQLPKIRAAWESDEVRQRAGGKALFVRHWLQNEEKQRAKNPPPPAPTATPGTDNSAFERLKREVAEVDANPPDPDRVRKLIRSVTGGG